MRSSGAALVRRVLGKLAKSVRAPHRWTVISVGAGRGLEFDPGDSNPGYAIGDNELPVQTAVWENLDEGGVLFDVGANVGFFSVIGARRVGSRGAVCALEPVPANATLIRQNAARNGLGNVTVIEAAATNRSGRGELNVARHAGGSALTTVEPPADACGRIAIDLVTIDELVFDRGIRAPTLVKIDVEGAEREVLAGMERTMRAYAPTIVLELDDEASARLDRKEAHCLQLLRSLGYVVRELPPSYPGIEWHVRHYLAVKA